MSKSPDREPRQPPTDEPKRLTDPEKAEVLLEAARTTAAGAAKNHGLSVRTIERWRQDIREGRLPDVARMVTEAQKESVRRSADKLLATQDILLDRMQELAPGMNTKDLTTALSTVGELVLARKALTGADGDEDGTADTGQGNSATEAARPNGGAPRGAQAPSAAGSVSDPVH